MTDELEAALDSLHFAGVCNAHIEWVDDEGKTHFYSHQYDKTQNCYDWFERLEIL